MPPNRDHPTGRATRAALGYASLGADGPDLATQRHGIQSACAELDLDLISFVWDREPQEPGQRVGLAGALDRIGAGEASCLVVTELERLSRDVGELATVLDRLERDDARLVVLDVGLDTATPAGRLAVGRPAIVDEPEGVVEASPPAPEAPREPVAARARILAFGYASAPADAPDVGKDLAGQQAALERYGAAEGFELVEVVRERENGARALDRAGLSYVIERVAAGTASCVVVDRLHRVTHSVAELGAIVQWFDRNGVRLIAIDDGLDTASPGGRKTVRALAPVAGRERERIRNALAAARAKRTEP